MKKAYLDEHGIMHVTEGETNYKHIETDIAACGGYPLHDGSPVVMYSLDEAYIDGNRKENMGTADLKLIPEIVALYEQLLNA